MTTRKKSKTDAVPAIGDRLLTPREAADVLRLSSRTMREYVQRGEMGGESSAGGGDLGVQTLTPSLQTLPVTGTSLEKTATGIRWWSADKVRTSLWHWCPCAGLRYSSEGGYLRPSGLGRLGQLGVMLRTFGNLPRPESWLPCVFTSLDAVAAELGIEAARYRSSVAERELPKLPLVNPKALERRVYWSILSSSLCFSLLRGPIRGSKPSAWHQIRSFPALR